jgi:hypothetical protein
VLSTKRKSLKRMEGCLHLTVTTCLSSAVPRAQREPGRCDANMTQHWPAMALCTD